MSASLPLKLQNALGLAAAALTGLGVFLVFVGWTVLIPSNIAWLDFGDRAMHTLGWLFFRQSPWQVPPGLSPDYGIELANSIGLVDGLPLLALPMKLLSPWLPQPFQYWGYWLCACFVLQGVFAYLIARALRLGHLLALLATGFVLITPALLFRIPMHMALSGHWTILAGLYLYMRRPVPPLWAWPLLAGGTAGIHVYLLAMVLGLWFAALVQRRWLRDLPLRRAAIEAIAIAALVALVLWLGGFFLTGSLGTYGFGAYRLNLLGLLTPYGWSKLLPELPRTGYDYEGLSFLGIGVLALLLIALLSGAVLGLRALATRRWLPLVLVVLLMTLFALSDRVAFGATELFAVPLPGWALAFGGMFRSTGRFVWPLLYLLTIGALVLVARRFRPRLVALVALLLLAAQIADSSPQWGRFKASLPAPAAVWRSDMVSPFWDHAVAAGYDRLRAIPVWDLNPGWKPLGYFAASHHLDIDAVYLGRVDAGALAALRAKEQRAVETGEFEPKTLYILDAGTAETAAHLVLPGDLFARIDGRIVFARDGAGLVADLMVDPHSALGG